MAALLGVKKVKIQFPEIFQNFSPPKNCFEKFHHP